MNHEPYGIDTPHYLYQPGMGLLHWQGMPVSGMTNERVITASSVAKKHKVLTPLDDTTLDRLRALTGWRLDDIAVACGLHPCTISNAKAGKKMENANKAKIVNFLDSLKERR